jgi:hypothetical protein
MKITFKGFLVENNYEIGRDGIVLLSHAVAVTRIDFTSPVCRPAFSVGLYKN